MTPHTKVGIAGVMVGLILLGFIPTWLALLVVVLAIALPSTAWLMLDPLQRRRYRELRRRQQEIRRGRTGEQRQDLPAKPISRLSDLGAMSSPSEAEGLSPKDRLTSARKEKPGRVLGSGEASERRGETTLAILGR
jgi:hypothetical protein